uniref:CBS domain-containing protein n=1 Tax=Heterorhabditis bacteriophora TaxID=37862 RepID=A0A1I7WWQ7_HETBA
MLEATKPVNVYCNGSTESGYESPNVSGESSRRNSVGFKEFIRNRRFTMMSRPNRVTMPIPNTTEASRKNSSADSNFCDVSDDLEDDLSPRPLYQRRMSVPEKVFMSAIHKALTALSQCGHQAAVVSNIEAKGGLGILTVTDCLRAIVLASEGVQKVAEQTVAQFLKTNNRKQLVSADVNAR